jgi:FKBP-type peptidyl-prolyl cis-trans isomerase
MECRRAASHPVDCTERGLVRRAPALFVAAALLLVSLTACSSNPNASCTNAAAPGSASNLVSVQGRFGSKPKVSIPTPLKTTTTESTVAIPGTGVKLEKNQELLMNYSIYSGATGKLLQSSGYGKAAEIPISVGHSGVTGLDKALLCSTVGSRLAVAIPPKDGFGTSAEGLGLGAADTAVMVVDVVNSFLPRANGAVQPRQSGFPIVVLAPDGTPGVNVPTTAPPAKLKIAVLKAGDGATVKRGSTVVTDYTGILWKERTVFDSTWSTGTPKIVVAASGANIQNGVVPGFASAIIGQKVGSQILVIVPPSKGYAGAGNSSLGVPANATLLYVIDILGVP